MQDLLDRAHKTGTHFSYGEKWYKELYSYQQNIPSGLANIYIKLDLNATRVSARHSLVHSILRPHKGLAYYFFGKEGNWIHTSSDFKQLAEIEGILCLSAQYSTFFQYEKLYTGALGVVAKQRMMSKVRCDRVSLIDLSNVTKNHKLPRTYINSSIMTYIGQRTKLRATLEAERRYCGNEGLFLLFALLYAVFSSLTFLFSSWYILSTRWNINWKRHRGIWPWEDGSGSRSTHGCYEWYRGQSLSLTWN